MNAEPLFPADTSAVSPAASLEHLAGRYPQGVFVLTHADAAGDPVISPVLTFFPVSEHPPRVGVVIPGEHAAALDPLKDGFGINVLSTDQAGLHRATLSGGERESPDEWQFTSTGVPVLSRTVAWMEAEVETRSRVTDDLQLVVARVRTHGENTRVPLIKVLGGYGELRTSTLSAVSDDLTDPLRVVDSIRPEMEALAADLGARVTAIALVKDQIVFLASAGHIEQPVGPVVPIGARAPAIAPTGATFLAWAPPDQVEQWLSLLDRAEDRAAARATAMDCLATVRTRGYTVYLHTPSHEQLWTDLASAWLPSAPQEISDKQFALMNTLVQDPPEFGPASVADVEWLSMPVFGPVGSVVVTLGVEGLPPPQDWQEFEVRLARLERATSNATRSIGGRVPVEVGQLEEWRV